MKVRAMRVRARASKMQRASDVSLWKLLRTIRSSWDEEMRKWQDGMKDSLEYWDCLSPDYQPPSSDYIGEMKRGHDEYLRNLTRSA